MFSRSSISGFSAAQLLLRAALAFVFIYVGFAALQQPTNWIGFVPPVVERVMSAETFLMLHAWIDIGIGILLAWGRYVRLGSILAFVFLVGISLTNTGATDIIFRDIGLALASLALFALYHNNTDDVTRAA